MGPPTTFNHHQPHSNTGALEYSLGLRHGEREHQTQTRNTTVRVGSRTSAERLLNSSQTESENGQDRQFSLLRDSLVFNHERLLQITVPQSQSRENYPIEENPTSVITQNPSPSPHYTSLSTLGVQSSVITEMNSSEEQSRPPIPKLYSVPNEPHPRQPNQLDANYNGSTGTDNASSPSWLRETIARRNAPIQNEDIQNALEKANLIDNVSGEDANEIPLTGTKASLHLPTPPRSPLSEGNNDVILKQPSATTITTVYSYKCERHPNHVHNANNDEMKHGLPLPTLRHGELVPPPPKSKRSVHQDCLLDIYRDENIPGSEYTPEDGNLIDHNYNPDEGTGDEPRDLLLLPTDNENEVENKRNDANLITNGDYATVMARLSGMRVPFSNEGSGDYYYEGQDGEKCEPGRCLPPNWRQQQQQQIDWSAMPHPSHDMYGPVHAFQYYARRQMMGRNHPAYAFLHVSHDDLEDDITIQIGQSQPIFPNPADLKWPEPSYLRMTLPQKFHPFLASGFKKDCRVWLWKNRKGRKAREMLNISGVPPKIISPTNSSSSLKNQRTHPHHDSPPNRSKGFSEKREMDIEEEINPNPNVVHKH